MRRTSTILAALVALVALSFAACGGEAQPAKSPDEASDSDAAAPEGEVSMANPDGAAPPDPDTPPPALAVALPLPVNAIKIVLKGKRKASLELKPDGTLTNGGKPTASFSRDGAIQDAKGQHVLTVKGDTVSTVSGATLATFSGDAELTTLAGDKLALDDAGALTLSSKDNESAIGKVEVVGNRKRAVLVATWFVLFPPPLDKLQEPKPARGGNKPKGRGKKR